MLSYARLAIFDLIRSRNPAVAFCAPNDPVGREVSIFGQHEKRVLSDLAEMIQQRLPHSRSLMMVDVGANIGTHTIALAPLFGSTLAFEPNPIVSLVAKANIQAAGIDNAQIETLGLSDHKATERLAVHPGAFSWGVFGRNDWPTVETQVATGDEMLSDRHSSVGFIKIDVEGHEPAVLRGLSNVMQSDRPIIAFEALDKRATAESLHILRQHGYDIFIGLGRMTSRLERAIYGIQPEAIREGQRYPLIAAIPRSLL
jgi:FkbM family methyltransferase